MTGPIPNKLKFSDLVCNYYYFDNRIKLFQ